MDTGAVDVAALMGVCSMTGYRNRLLLTASEEPTLKLHLQPSEDALHAAGKLVEELRLRTQSGAEKQKEK